MYTYKEILIMKINIMQAICGTMRYNNVKYSLHKNL